MKHPVIPLFTALLLAPLGSPVLFAASPGPERGFVSSQAATNWEHALTSGNGKFGALIYGQPLDETIVLNHARLFMPLHEPIPPVDTASHLKEIRQMLADGHYQRAADFVVELSKKEGYSEKRWTDPFVPAFEPPLSPGFRWGGCNRSAAQMDNRENRDECPARASESERSADRRNKVKSTVQNAVKSKGMKMQFLAMGLVKWGSGNFRQG